MTARRRILPRGCWGPILVAASLLLTHANAGVPEHPPILTDLNDYCWPTDAGHLITSVFGEYRRAHFHAGIDISTGDVTGYKVFAMRDGYVTRIHIDATGYGKILYVRHADGYTTTYAHLSRFAGAIEDRAQKEQERLQQYPVDIELAPNELSVKKGDVIAYTGDTGIGTPHLHVEIRDPNDEPINPELCPALRIPDGIPPTILKIALIPIVAAGERPSDNTPEIHALTSTGPGRYHLREPILVTGRAGLAIDVRDRTEGSVYRRGIYRLRLCIDRDTVATCTYDRAPLHDAQLIGAAYDWPLVDRRRGRFARLFETIPGVLPYFYTSESTGGAIGPGVFQRGIHRFTITAEDIAGNTSVVEGTLVISRPPMVTVDRRGTTLVVAIPDPAGVTRLEEGILGLDGEWSNRRHTLRAGADQHLVEIPLPKQPAQAIRVVAVGKWGERSSPRIIPLQPRRHPSPRMEVTHDLDNDLVRITIRCDGVFTVPPEGMLREGSHETPLVLEPVDVGRYEALASLDPAFAGIRNLSIRASIDGVAVEGEDAFDAYPILPGRQGTYAFDHGRLSIDFDSASVFSPLFLHVDTLESGDESGYALTPALFILHRGLTVTVRADSLLPHAGLYFRGRTGLRYLGRPVDLGPGVLSGRVLQTLGTLSIRTDDRPPDVSRLFISSGRHRPLTIRFRITDDLSGVEYESVKLYIDNTPVIPSIDGEHRRVQYQSSAPLERGSHRFLMRCSDRAGNVRTVERQFTVR